MNPAAATILVIDDDPASLDLAARHLGGYDYAVLTARDGERGFRRALHVRPDLVLLDLGLPGIDGHEVCRRLKAHPTTRDIPVVFLTARTGMDDKRRAFELDGVDYLLKPFAEAELLARVRLHLDQARNMSELHQRAEQLGAELQEARAQLTNALARRDEEDAECARLRALTEVLRAQLEARLERWLAAEETEAPPRRLDAPERARLAIEMMQAMQARLGVQETMELGRAITLLQPMLDGSDASPRPLLAGQADPLERLSHREREVFDLLVGGRTNKQIAAALGVSSSTVTTYRVRVMQKLDAPDVPALVRIGLLHHH